MEFFKIVSDFYETVRDDTRINSKHISLYFALLYEYHLTDGATAITVARDELMKAAKINSRYTYNKYMNELDKYGYIRYDPSSNHFEGSKVYLKRL